MEGFEEVLKCNHCNKLVAFVTYEVLWSDGSSKHVRADCAECGRYIKFVKQHGCALLNQPKKEIPFK